MKNVRKRLATLALAFVVACTSLAPVTVNAAPYVNSSQTVYREQKKGTSYTSIYVGNLTKSQTIKKSSVKSSKTSVATLYYLEKNAYTSSYKTEYFEKGLTDYSNSDSEYYYYIGLKLKKAGSSKISFKIGSKSYSSTVKVYDYTNPVKQIKVGTTTVAGSKFKSANVYGAKNAKKLSNAKVTVSANDGWKITRVEVEDKTTYEELQYSCSSNPKSTVTVQYGTFAKNKPYTIDVTFYNTKTKAYMYVTYYMNYKKYTSSDGSIWYSRY